MYLCINLFIIRTFFSSTFLYLFGPGFSTKVILVLLRLRSYEVFRF